MDASPHAFDQDRAAHIRRIAPGYDVLHDALLHVMADLIGNRADPSFAPRFAAWRAHYRHAGASAAEADRAFAYIDRSISFIGEGALQTLLHDVGFGPLARFYQCYLWGAWLTRRET